MIREFPMYPKPRMRPCMQGYWCGIRGAVGCGGETMREAYRMWRIMMNTGIGIESAIFDWKYEEWITNHHG